MPTIKEIKMELDKREIEYLSGARKADLEVLLVPAPAEPVPAEPVHEDWPRNIKVDDSDDDFVDPNAIPDTQA